MCVCVCVCARARARARACVCYNDDNKQIHRPGMSRVTMSVSPSLL